MSQGVNVKKWTGIEPGDIGFDQGGGVVGFLIRHFSHSPYAHCWVYHTLIEDDEGQPLWRTVEAYPGGLKYRDRYPQRVHRVLRVWRDEDERQGLLHKSGDLVGVGYNYRELFRIVHYRLRKSFVYLAAIAIVLAVVGVWLGSTTLNVLAWVSLGLMLYAAIPLSTKLNPDRVICSNHVAQSVLAARPDVVLSYEPQSIWPGRLERDLNLITWHDWLKQR